MSGERGGKKRHSSQPLGGDAKDARGEDDFGQASSDVATWSEVATRGGGRGGGGRGAGSFTSNRFDLLSSANSYPDKTMRSGSICSRGSARGSSRGRISSQQQQQQIGRNMTGSNGNRGDESQRKTDLGDLTRFVTPPADGQMRDEFTVECQKLNDRPFKGTVTFDEARDTIFHEILGFDYTDLYSIRMRYSGCPILKFKLKQQTNIDALTNVEYFNLERKTQNSDRIDYIQCRVLGIRGMQSVPHYDGSENDVRWVKIEGCEYQLTEEEIKEGLAPFGEILTPIREDIYEDSDSERDAVGNGTYSVKMKLDRPIPQFLPMHGRRIRIYHSGITKLCTNCFGRHTRRQCKNLKTPWIVYVRDFMKENEELGAKYYGKWWDIVENEFPGYFDIPDDDERQHSTTQAHSQSQRPEQTTRFADKRSEPTKMSRDPRLQKRAEKQSTSAPPSNQGTQTDRQMEIARLLATGLTLTDARKYLQNQDEQREIEKRMSRSTNAGHLYNN